MGRYYKGTRPVFIEGNIYQPPFEMIAEAIQTINLGIEQNKADIQNSEDLMQGVLDNVFSFDRDETKKILDQFSSKITSQAELLQKDPLGSFRKRGDLDNLKRSISKELKFGKISKNIGNRQALDAWEKKEMERVGAEKNGITYDELKVAKNYALSNLQKAGGTLYNPETGEYNSISSFLEPLVATPDFNKIVQEAIKGIGTTKRTENWAYSDGKWIKSGTSSLEEYDTRILYNAAKMALESDPGVQAYIAQKKKFGSLDEYGAYSLIEREAMEGMGSKYKFEKESGTKSMSGDPYSLSRLDEEKQKRLLDYKKKIESPSEKPLIKETRSQKPSELFLEPFKKINETKNNIKYYKGKQQEVYDKYLKLYDGNKELAYKKALEDPNFKNFQYNIKRESIGLETARKTTKLLNDKFIEYAKGEYDKGNINKEQFNLIKKSGYLGSHNIFEEVEKAKAKSGTGISTEAIKKASPFGFFATDFSDVASDLENIGNDISNLFNKSNFKNIYDIVSGFKNDKENILFKESPTEDFYLGIDLNLPEDVAPTYKNTSPLSLEAYDVLSYVKSSDVYQRDLEGNMKVIKEKQSDGFKKENFKQSKLFIDPNTNDVFIVGDYKGKEVYISADRFADFGLRVKQEYNNQGIDTGANSRDPVRQYAYNLVEENTSPLKDPENFLENSIEAKLIEYKDDDNKEYNIYLNTTENGDYYFTKDVEGNGKERRILKFFDIDSRTEKSMLNKREAIDYTTYFLKTNKN